MQTYDVNYNDAEWLCIHMILYIGGVYSGTREEPWNSEGTAYAL